MCASQFLLLLLLLVGLLSRPPLPSAMTSRARRTGLNFKRTSVRAGGQFSGLTKLPPPISNKYRCSNGRARGRANRASRRTPKCFSQLPPSRATRAPSWPETAANSGPDRGAELMRAAPRWRPRVGPLLEVGARERAPSVEFGSESASESVLKAIDKPGRPSHTIGRSGSERAPRPTAALAWQ